MYRKTGLRLLDIEGKQVALMETWADPDNITQLGSAIKALHEK
jgi:hypothetical protein